MCVVVIVQGSGIKIIERIDCIVIGAGVIGLACARSLALSGREVVILECENTFGTQTSSRHSEVIHAGIYYPVGTNKANWCVAGKHKLYNFCEEHNIPHKAVGKLIIATDFSEIAALDDIYVKAIANGVHDLQYLSQQEINQLEPEVRAVAGLLSLSTGIIDSHTYMLAVLGQAQAAGAMLAVNSVVQSGKVCRDGIILNVISDGLEMQIVANCVINCAGLQASDVSFAVDGVNKDEVPKTYYRKGVYFTYNAANPFNRLIYPVPVPGGLGTHSTMDLSGQIRFGPDVELIQNLDYSVDDSKRYEFAEAIARYWPAVNVDLLQPGYAGIRPSLADAAGGFKDFCVVRHKLEVNTVRYIGLYGIESPGLTSSLSLADAVLQLTAVSVGQDAYLDIPTT